MGRLIEFIKKNYKVLAAVIVCVCCVAAVLGIVMLNGGGEKINDEKKEPVLNTTYEDVSEAYKKADDELPDMTDVPIEKSEEVEEKRTSQTVSADISGTNAPAEKKTVDDVQPETENHANSNAQTVEEPKTNNASADENKNLCTFSISCATVNENIDKLDKSKKAFIPADGWILSPTEVAFEDGESVFDVLEKVTKQNKIQMEFTKTPAYNSVYIEGINNLYEFDCGSLSGWMYSVNGNFPKFGCSLYSLKKGDVVQFVYTCDLGKDVGGGQ